MSENRREFFRVEFTQSIDGEMVRSGGDSMFINIENVSVTGLKFMSSFDLPIQEKVTCRFNILECPYLLDGKIIRKVKKPGEFEYGIGFDIDQETSSHLFKQLNYYVIRQRKGNVMD